MVVKVGLKPTYNLLLNTWYRSTSPIFHFKKQFLTLLELSSDLLLALSPAYAPGRLDASTSSRYKLLHPYKESHQAGGGCFCFRIVCNFNKNYTTVYNATVSN
jgi:hypothetical protein